MKHFIVTGGAGFIGSHVCDELIARGYAVTAVDNFVTGRKKNLEAADKAGGPQAFQLVEWDVSNPIPESMLGFVSRFGIEGILHLACPASPVDFDRIPFEIMAVSSAGTKNTVDLALKYNARYLFASTSEAYGDPLVHPQDESYWGNVNSIGPRACYDEAKRFGEAYVSTAIRLKKLNGRIIRIFNTYGPRMRPDDGRIVPELCVRAISAQPLTVHGDGKQTRSFCYVDDLVNGMLRLLDSNLTRPVNIGNPNEYSVLDFVAALEKIVGTSKLPIRFEDARIDDPKRRCPDITLARSHLNWEPRVSLEVGIAKCIAYFQNEART